MPGPIGERHTQAGRFKEAIATMEGQTLYELYAQRLLDWPLDGPLMVIGKAELGAVPNLEPVQWKNLPPTRKAFWQELAQDFIKAAT